MKRLAVAGLLACNMASLAETKTACEPSRVQNLVSREQAPGNILKLVSVAAQYPEKAIKLGKEGSVEIQYVVDSSGATCDLKVLASTPRGLFSQSALEAVSQWKFATVMSDEGPVAVKGMVSTLNFSLSEPQRPVPFEEAPQVACKPEELTPVVRGVRRPYSTVSPYERQGAEPAKGWVQLEYSINTLGEVCDVKVLGADPPGRFEAISVEALLKWKFHPIKNAQGQGMATPRMKYRWDFTR